MPFKVRCANRYTNLISIYLSSVPNILFKCHFNTYGTPHIYFRHTGAEDPQFGWFQCMRFSMVAYELVMHSVKLSNYCELRTAEYCVMCKRTSLWLYFEVWRFVLCKWSLLWFDLQFSLPVNQYRHFHNNTRQRYQVQIWMGVYIKLYSIISKTESKISSIVFKLPVNKGVPCPPKRFNNPIGREQHRWFNLARHVIAWGCRADDCPGGVCACTLTRPTPRTLWPTTHQVRVGRSLVTMEYIYSGIHPCANV